MTYLVSVDPGEVDRFWSKVDKSDGCWVWTGAISNSHSGPYGKFRSAIAQHPLAAHRLAFYYETGVLSTRDEVLDHVCRNTLCVRPSHLELVSDRENVARGDGPTAVNSRKTHCIRGHEFTPENTWANGTGRKCKECHRAINREWARKSRAARRQ